MSIGRQKKSVIRTRIKGTLLLLLLVGEAFCLVAIVTPPFVALSTSYYIGLAAVLLGIGVLLWRPAITEPVERIKKEITTAHLSDETLVRPSQMPPTQQQTELLRAAQYGKETPIEELLRAGGESRQG